MVGLDRLAAAGRVLVLLAFGAVAPHAQETGTVSGMASGFDGDQIEIAGRRYRLAGIDAPERGQTCSDARERIYPCGRDAEWVLAEKIAGKRVDCTVLRATAATPPQARCRLGGEDLGAFMVERGLAIVDRRIATPYAPLEEVARSAGRGIWIGSFTAPADYRDGARGRPDGRFVPIPRHAALGHAQTDKAERERDCPIKGNITREGSKLYWVPGSRRYDETVIVESQGERWFCTEDEARLAGWEEPDNPMGSP